SRRAAMLHGASRTFRVGLWATGSPANAPTGRSTRPLAASCRGGTPRIAEEGRAVTSDADHAHEAAALMVAGRFRELRNPTWCSQLRKVLTDNIRSTYGSGSVSGC